MIKGDLLPASPLIIVGKDFLASSISGMSAVIAGHPFDTIKVLVQNGDRFRNSVDAFKHVIHCEGFRGLYRGIAAPLASVAVVNSSFFTINGQMQKLLHDKEKDGPLVPLDKVAVAGAVAGASIGFIITPRDLVKSKLQVQERLPPSPSSPSHPLYHQSVYYKGSWDCAKKVFRQNGIRGLYRGFLVTLARDIPGDTAYFFVYEYVKRTLMSRLQQDGTPCSTPPGWVVCTAGGFAGMSFWATIFPLDAIKTRIQAQSDISPQYKNSWDCAKHIYQSQGLRGFYRGFVATLLRSFPTSSVNFLVFETMRKLLGSFIEEK